MKFWLRKFLFKPVVWFSDKFSSNPDRERVYKELSSLLASIVEGNPKKGLIIPFNAKKDKFIIFSDQHKGAKNGADDFMLCEPSYLSAMEYYYQNDFFFISLGDCEELWKNNLAQIKKNQKPSFSWDKAFIEKNRFIKIFGNHDLYWQNDPFAHFQLKEIYGLDIPIYEGVLLQTTFNKSSLNVFCAHGHQGDLVSDGNWFSKFFISRIWAPLQDLLKINPNTPAYDAQLKTLHNSIMYDWSAKQERLVLITGHTHQPVFESLTHIESLYQELFLAQQKQDEPLIISLEKEIQARKFEYNHVSNNYINLKPTYFNSGCCCYDDGDITGIEIEGGCIRLIKWHGKSGSPLRIVLDETSLEDLGLRLS
ncbi:MAG: metallophosphoesterase [Flavisolibacter sp.]